MRNILAGYFQLSRIRKAIRTHGAVSTVKTKERQSCATLATFVVVVTIGPVDVGNEDKGRETDGAAAEGQEVAPPHDSLQ